MTSAVFSVTLSMKEEIWSHLLRPNSEHSCPEEAAFGFANARRDRIAMLFELVDWIPVGADGFEEQSGYYIELADATKGQMIKRAHDLGLSLVEFHSHPFQRTAEFSPSDLSGLREFVPHVWWRLKGRPYLAVVVAPMSFDAVAWIDDPLTPVRVREISMGETTLAASGRTVLSRGF